MAKFDERVEELLAKHPSLTKDEAIKIVTDKNERKKAKRAKKVAQSHSQKTRTISPTKSELLAKGITQ